MTTALAAHHLTAAADTNYRGRRHHVKILQPTSLHLQAGQIQALVGESGCGKSMIARTLIGLPPAAVTVAGTVTVGEHTLNVAGDRRWTLVRGHRIGYVPQSMSTAFTPGRTVGHQLRQVCTVLGADRSPDQLAATVDLPTSALGLYPHQLSGGMAQRAAIAAALAGRPDVLVCDEPTSAMDPDLAGHTWQVLADAAGTGAAILVITHDMTALHTADVVDEVAVMRAGKIVAHTHPHDLAAHSDSYVAAFADTRIPC